MLGSQQKRKLDKYKGPYSEPVSLTVRVHPFRPYSRELGRGHDITVELRYTTDGTVDLMHTVANCATEEIAIHKALEVAQFLLTLGVNRGSIKVVRKAQVERGK